ncbi:NADP-specific glutamate dehydrogenase [Reinekea blandensis]|uniref:Glutamate dehydrogenase n=1 Tax=Reinekea blandensis MED297 TaxID=314283 RepID=A4BI48_9GAMM|nr:NADP-specific glutamate dehydrogenase [Reinekea blandensis]EAR08191.1 glutamate dehydrogenase [Reinekea sp. MED297] [Reinekea blandensis MED297]
MSDQDTLQDVLDWVCARAEGQEEFIEAFTEVAQDVSADVKANASFQSHAILRRLSEPDRIISFRVVWEDDEHRVQVNRGWRVQHCNAIGPYKGGIRFHPTVNESILKFLAFEQTFKNALTGLPIGGGKGGSDFDPRGRSDAEIMRFCQAFMTELHRHIGERTDVPAGDINVGSREIGYLFGQYRRLENRFAGTMTGKDIEFGGSHVRVEATGYGLVYFVQEMLKAQDEDLDDKRILISGAGNVATHAALKSIEQGGRVLTLSSSQGVLICEDGFTAEQIETVMDADGSSTERLKSLLDEEAGMQWKEDAQPWDIDADIALPCATQNELDETAAQTLVDHGIQLIAEGANMPCTAEAIDVFEANDIPHAPGKASNAGGVALSGLEMHQNAQFSQLSFSHLDEELKQVMASIHQQCLQFGQQDDKLSYRRGANRAAFERVAKALVSQGLF